MSLYEFVDELGRVIRSGRLRAVGGTVGDVPTQQADQSLSQSPGGGLQPFTVVERTIDNAAILALRASEVEVIDPPGVGKAIYITALTCSLDQSNGAYDSDSDNAELDVGFANYWINVLADVVTPIYGGFFPLFSAAALSLFPTGGVPQNVSIVENVGFCIGNVGIEELTGGGAGNTFTVKATYQIIDTTPPSA